ncbi:hypothetical protein [Streptomyces sp. 147326]|uniref:hypothetical protein n=1 Tax=Streptomyces sp. 147326 TaxID=3074379 RepID=UPI0038579A54
MIVGVGVGVGVGGTVMLLLGLVRIRRMFAAHDLGRVVGPSGPMALLEGTVTSSTPPANS